MIEVLLLMSVAAALLLCVLAARRLERRYDSLRDEVGALWRRIEWLCRDTDDRLSVDRLELQQKSTMQIPFSSYCFNCLCKYRNFILKKAIV